jgi:ethanolamine ammonia-lyase small subunit
MPPEHNQFAKPDLPQNDPPNQDLPEIIKKIRAKTPARLLTGRSGAAYRTITQLDLRDAHAAARDAVRAELDLTTDLAAVAEKWKLFEVCSQAAGKDEYLLRPDLGRHLNDASRATIKERCTPGHDLQITIGDGLSVTAIATQVPLLLPPLAEGARARSWTLGQLFVIRYCRVGILNEIGELLAPKVAILLIGERPGLATSESLSAYMAYRPKPSHTDADRNLISNIHARGVSPEQAAERILNLAASMMKTSKSGSQLREEPPALTSPDPQPSCSPV